jgi:PIN domain nuclease of toxin-antitoxin system
VTRVLVDAHVVVWTLVESTRLSKAAASTLRTADDVLVSGGTLHELAVKRSLGKLRLPDDWTARAAAWGFHHLPMRWAHASALEELPFVEVDGRLHRDPFDRLLAAQALAEGLPVVTVDPAFDAYGVRTIW